MAATTATSNAQIAALQAQAAAAAQTLAGLGVNVAGGGAPAPAPAVAAPGTPVGAATNTLTAAAAATPANAATTAPATGATQAKATVTATGKPQVLLIGGQTKYFPAGVAGQPVQEITAFQYADSQQFKIALDYKDGIATGLANLSRIFGARQERVRVLSNALASDADSSGSFNPVDLQKMSLETTTTQQLSEMQKKIFDSMKDSISPWLR